jgi:hypothetical protein
VAGAAVLVVLALGGCGRADATGAAGTAGTPAPGASVAATSPAPGTTREDGATSAPGGAAAVQQALDGANALADEVDRDIASDNS